MDEFDKVIKTLYESTHSGKMRESLLEVYNYRQEFVLSNEISKSDVTFRTLIVERIKLKSDLYKLNSFLSKVSELESVGIRRKMIYLKKYLDI